MRRSAALFAAVLLASCATTPPESSYPQRTAAKVKEADNAMVEGCEFLGTVVGKSGWGGLAAGAARNGAMRSAKKRAASLGATHIVVAGFDVGSGYTMKASTLNARAYRCTQEKEAESDPG